MSRHQNRDEWIEEETDILRYNGFSMRDSIRIANATADELDKKNNFIVKIPNSNIKNSLKVGEKISISWDSKDCHALDA